jgi:antitoxin ParD1/3/4
MPTRNINLTDHFDRFIESSVASGRFSNASELVREGLRLLEQHEQENRAKLEWLRSAVQEGIAGMESGEYTTIRSKRELEDFMRQLREQTSAELKAERARA